MRLVSCAEIGLLAVERFHSFREVHTLQWHAHRHAIGQAFLDQFVRQVCVEIYWNWALADIDGDRISLKLMKFPGMRRLRKSFFPRLNGPYIWNSSIICALST